MSQILRSIFLLMFILMSTAIMAIPGDMEDGDGTNVPVDGGITLLLSAGAAYGVRRLRRKDAPRNAQ